MNQTSITLTLAATNKSMSVLDSVSLRVSHSALSSRVEPRILLINAASALPEPEQQIAVHSSCDDNGLQSSIQLSQIALVAGKATIEVWPLLVQASASPFPLLTCPYFDRYHLTALMSTLLCMPFGTGCHICPGCELISSIALCISRPALQY